MQIWSVVNLADKLKPDCLLTTSVLSPFRNELVTLLASTIMSRTETQPIHTSGYRDEQFNLDTTTNTLELRAQ